MMKYVRNLRWKKFSILLLVVLISGCIGIESEVEIEPTIASAAQPDLPKITTVDLDRSELPRYKSMEFFLGIEAEYTNPYDLREIHLDGLFTAPDGTEMMIPGFWDGAEILAVAFHSFSGRYLEISVDSHR